MLVLFAAWCILFVLCWPVAVVALIVAPLVLLVSLPFRLIGICLHAVFALFRAALLLPARLLGYWDVDAPWVGCNADVWGARSSLGQEVARVFLVSASVLRSSRIEPAQ